MSGERCGENRLYAADGLEPSKGMLAVNAQLPERMAPGQRRSERNKGLVLANEQYRRLQEKFLTADPVEKCVINRRLVNLLAVIEYLGCNTGTSN